MASDTRLDVPVPPYVSYRTFKGFLEWLREGIPDRIDRSFWGQKLNGSNGIQTMTALRVLGLISAENRPTMTLERLVNSEGEERQDVLRSLMRDNYGPIFELPLGRATHSQLREAFKAYTGKEAVLNKCVAFFVQAAKDAGIDLSPHILKGTRTPRQTALRPRGSGRRTVSPATQGNQGQASASRNEETSRRPGSVRAVKLKSGGELTLTVDVDLFDLSESDRSFVIRVVDEFRRYAEEHDEGRDQSQ